jgi:ComF family protein
MRNFLGDAFFGGACFVCRGKASGLLCPACRAELPLLAAELCPRCALPAPGGALCGRCLAEPPDYDATFAALAYDFPADALVHALKFRGELALAPLLGGLLRDRLPADDPVDCVVPVPLSAARLRSRGYNQAVEIARHVAPARIDIELCARQRDGAPQMELPWAERQRNVRGAFDCRRVLLGARVAVVDDVMTTGATLDEMARTLKRAGAARVVNWVVARTLPPA